MKELIHPYCQFKTPEVERRTPFLCEVATEVLNAMAEYCEVANLPMTITDSVSTPEEDKALSRVSDEHSTARAFDMSIHGWQEGEINAFTLYFEKRFMSVGAIGKKTGMPHLIFRHSNGHGDHIHVQVARCYEIKNPLAEQTVLV